MPTEKVGITERVIEIRRKVAKREDGISLAEASLKKERERRRVHAMSPTHLCPRQMDRKAQCSSSESNRTRVVRHSASPRSSASWLCYLFEFDSPVSVRIYIHMHKAARACEARLAASVPAFALRGARSRLRRPACIVKAIRLKTAHGWMLL